MIQVNLVPDIKQALIRAERIRSTVIFFATLISMIAAGIVIALVVWVYGIQTGISAYYDGKIKTQDDAIHAVKDIEKTLTIQNQVNQLSALHDDKNISSRIFDVLSAIVPSAPNDVAITNAALSNKDQTIVMEAQAKGGYAALEIFRKTIDAAELEYADGGTIKRVSLASDLVDADRNFGENSNGEKVLRFTVSFGYPAELFSRKVTGLKITTPTSTNVTDSLQGVPQTLFAENTDKKQGKKD